MDFDVLDGWVSFHHSLHWLLAELLKNVNILSEEPLSRVGVTSVRDLFMRIATEDAVLTLIDFPLRGALHGVPALFSCLTWFISARHGRPNPLWTVGPQRLSDTRSIAALPRFHATRAVLRPGFVHSPDVTHHPGPKHGHCEDPRPLQAPPVLPWRSGPSNL